MFVQEQHLIERSIGLDPQVSAGSEPITMIWLKYISAVIIFILPFINGKSIARHEKEQIQYFLNGKVKPYNYNIHLNTHVENCDKTCSYEGKINITVLVDQKIVDANEKVYEIQLNAQNEINIGLCKLQDETGADIPVKLSRNNKTEIITVKSAQELKRHKKYYLYFEYSRINENGMFGFYKSHYKTPQGTERWLLTTQYQPNYARNAYPCFDEPKFKATYEMAITISKKAASDGYHALFNTYLVEKIETQNNVTYVFSRTPYPVSSYLIAFIVSDFKVTDTIQFVSDYGPEKNVQKKFKTWGEDKYIVRGDGSFAQAVGSTAIKNLSDYFGIGYAFPKMDLVGIPDFAAGAMENWGLVTFREKGLFYNKRTASVFTKFATVRVITHELIHQWFGNLVSPESWDYIWLNEGFATYFAYVIGAKVANKLNLCWDTNGLMISHEVQTRAFETDALENSRALSTKIIDPSITPSYFDSISYSKAVSVLRMWHNALGEKAFRKGLNIYLNARKEDVAVPRDLLKSFEKACNETKCIDPVKVGLVSDLFGVWHTTPGYPLVKVEKVGKTKYKISQERFLWSPPKNTSVEQNKYNIPITYSTSSEPQFENTKPRIWFKKTERSVEIDVNQEEKWIILNNQHTGYYRINYDERNWMELINQLKKDHSVIHENNRAQLINDIFSFGRSTHKDYKVGYDVALNLAGYLIKEKNFAPWRSAVNAFSFLSSKLTPRAKPKFQKYVMHLLKPRYDSLGLTVQDENAFLDNLLRMDVSEWACSLGYKSCIEDALRLYRNSSAISPDVMKTVYCTAIREGGDEIWDDVWNMYLKCPDNVQQATFLSSLGCSKSAKKLFQFMEKTIIPNSGIRQQDYTIAFSSVYQAGNTQAALTFLGEKFEEISKNYNGMDPLGVLLIGLSSNLNSPKDLAVMKELKQKIEKSDLEVVKMAQASISKAIEIVESNIKWINLKLPAIESWLENNQLSS